jgi:hypothetical protein
MKKMGLGLFQAGLLLMASTTASAAAISHTLGDDDFFGFGLAIGTIGDPVPAFDFNNQEVSDPLFTDHELFYKIASSGP